MALVDAYLREHLGRQRHVSVGQLGLEDLTDPSLVDRVEERPQARHRDGLDLGLAQPLGGVVNVALVQRGRDLAVDRDPLVDHLDPVARDQRRRRRVLLELALLQAAAHVQHVTEALGGDEAGDGALPGQHRVRGDRGSVHDRRHPRQEVVELHPVFAGRPLQRGEETDRRVTRRGGGLVHPALAGSVGNQQVGERAADVHADTVGRGSVHERGSL